MGEWRDMWKQVEAMADRVKADVSALSTLGWSVGACPDGLLYARCRKRTGPNAGRRVTAATVAGLMKQVEELNAPGRK